ncbi:ABC transporter permease [Cytobacillus kochii]|uniref:FtsX-like permease family protein n=1 Tax=Cytobacillus kochii TaxID=859143 RepID=UPI002480A817|nr:ABC transporter permease [Cytobacillus kochii]
MARYLSLIFKNWKQKKDRFVLILLGAILIGGGMNLLFSLTETKQGTIVDTLQNKWESSYHIVVRPTGTKSITEEHNLFEPNYLSGISGGITLEQYRTIKNMDDIQVAAPLSIIGFMNINILLDNLSIDEPGIYKIEEKITTNNTLNDYSKTRDSYFSRGIYEEATPEIYRKYGFTSFDGDLYKGSPLLLAGIDPIEEAKLVGLNKSVISSPDSSYFSDDNLVKSYTLEELGYVGVQGELTEFPVILSTHPSIKENTQINVTKLDIPFESNLERKESLEKISKNGGESFLNTINGNEISNFQYTANDIHNKWLDLFSNNTVKNATELSGPLYEKTSSLSYKDETSPFPNRWKNAYSLDSVNENTDDGVIMFREAQLKGTSIKNRPRLQPYLIGMYDPTDLDISKNTENELPMETYKSPTGTHVLDSNNNPINPTEDVYPTSNIYEPLIQSPSMLTTIEAAQKILGDKAISSVRIKIKDVADFSEESQQKLEKIAAEIEEKTGLEADIMLGSSPSPVIVNITNNNKEIGWMEQAWIKVGASMQILQETTLGYSSIIIILIIVAIVYVFSTTYVTFLARKKEFAILIAMGWKVKHIQMLILFESLFIGFIICITSLFVQFLVQSLSGYQLIYSKLLLLILFILFIYIIGPLIPIYLIKKINPNEILKNDEISTKKTIIHVKNLISLIINSIFRRKVRNSISIIAIAIPTSLLIVYIYISLRLDDILFSSWLGEYVALEINIVHYFSVAIAFFISILTISELMWQNLSERKKEFALLYVVGWKKGDITKVIIGEGAIIGLIGGFIGAFIAICILYFMYHSLDIKSLWIIAIAIIIPIISGIIGSMIPLKKVTKIQPINFLKT